MRFDVITLFPELFEPFLQTGVTRRAYETGQIELKLWQLRDFAQGNYRRVDDRPFGGGPGMVMQAEPLWQCLQAIRASRAEAPEQATPVVLFSPIGQRLDHRVGVAHGGVDAGANGGAAHVHFGHQIGGFAQTLFIVGNHGGKCCEFLAQRHGHGVL